MQLFYDPTISEGNKEAVFSREESKHIVKVLRKKEGEILFLTNGKGWRFKTEITSADHKKCKVRILSSEKAPKPGFYIHLAVAPTKKNERFEWFLEKATELGIMEITPVICDHNERKIIKPERYEKVIVSAMKQSLQTYLPVLNKAVLFQEFIQKEYPGQRFIAHCEEEEGKKILGREAKMNSAVNILIGPEGDFSSEEIDRAIKNNWEPISLGKTRMRTETAAVMAGHTIVLINELAENRFQK